jgi:hypothetical protein
METTRSPSARSISRTPCVSRPNRSQIARRHANDLPLLRDEQHLIGVRYAVDAHDQAVPLAGLDVLQADAAARLAAILRHRGPLAEAHSHTVKSVASSLTTSIATTSSPSRS